MKDIYWIGHDEHPHLAIVARPRGDDWLEEDLANLKRGGIEILVSLLTPSRQSTWVWRLSAILRNDWASNLSHIQFSIARRPVILADSVCW